MSFYSLDNYSSRPHVRYTKLSLSHTLWVTKEIEVQSMSSTRQDRSYPVTLRGGVQFHLVIDIIYHFSTSHVTWKCEWSSNWSTGHLQLSF